MITSLLIVVVVLEIAILYLISFYLLTKKKEVSQEVQHLEAAAEQGKIHAMVELATRFQFTDLKKSRYWAAEAAARDDSVGCYLMANLTEDLNQRIFWMKKSASLGHAVAQYRMGCLTVDPKESAEWFEKSATQGYLPAIQKQEEKGG